MAEGSTPQIEQIDADTPRLALGVRRPIAQRAPRPQRRQRAPRQPGAPPAPPATPPPAFVTPRLPTSIATHLTGVDRRDVPRRGRPPVADPDWMSTLIAHSNLRFTGAYVTGAALTGRGISAGDFTGSSKAVSRAWMPNMQRLTDQGWGAAFFYVGYSVGGGEPAPTGVDTARGTLHGKHLRTVITALGPNFAGAVIFIDNEDGTSTTLPQSVIDYYNGLFTEMVRPDPNLTSCRPGLYGHGTPLSTMLKSLRNLYLWDVWLDTSATTTTDAPFGATLPLNIDPSTRPLKAYIASPPNVQASIA